LGNPHERTSSALFAYFGVDNDEALRRRVDDDCRWQPAEWTGAYRHPEGLPMFDIMHGLGPKKSHGQPGCFADTTDVAEIDAHPWPDAAYMDLEPIRKVAETTSDCWRLGGTWSPFFHIVADYFGMENYFMKMYTDPDVVHAVTRRVVDFYLESNRRVFTEVGDCVDAFFFGNDFGTQEDLLISPDKFKEFVLPYFAELIALAREYGKPTQLHSCGAIAKVIPWLIDAGMDALHPLQAKARGMDAETLSREFKGKVVFVGGVDTQELMWKGTPQQIKDEVARLRELFGDRWIVSPSHEVLMPEVPVENAVALCEAATA
jgi:uroporphyrinogen decarboxylase